MAKITMNLLVNDDKFFETVTNNMESKNLDWREMSKNIWYDLFEPKIFSSFKSKEVMAGVNFIYGFRSIDKNWVVQSMRFDRELFDLIKAKEFIKSKEVEELFKKNVPRDLGNFPVKELNEKIFKDLDSLANELFDKRSSLVKIQKIPKGEEFVYTKNGDRPELDGLSDKSYTAIFIKKDDDYYMKRVLSFDSVDVKHLKEEEIRNKFNFKYNIKNCQSITSKGFHDFLDIINIMLDENNELVITNLEDYSVYVYEKENSEKDTVRDGEDDSGTDSGRRLVEKEDSEETGNQ